MEDELRFRRNTRVRIRFLAVVVNAKLGQFRHELNQVKPAAIVPCADFSVWYVVPASRNPGAHAGDVKLRAAQPRIPDPHLDSYRKRRFKQSCDCVAAERGLEGE